MDRNDFIDSLMARESIRDTIYRSCRALDRLDRELLRSCFHEDASISMGTLYEGGLDGFIDLAMAFQGSMRDTQHSVSNILLEIEGAVASGESYVHAHHVIEEQGELVELIVGARYLDRFRFTGSTGWRLCGRSEVMDWARMVPIGERWFEENSELPKGRRDRDDPSYRYLQHLPASSAGG